MFKKISFVIITNIILLLFLELSVKLILKSLNLPLVYKVGNIGINRYDFLTGYYNLPNQDEKIDKFYIQATDKYGFNLDGERHPLNLEEKAENEIRIFIVGGSTVQGRDLKNKFDPISARLERKLNDKFKNDNKIYYVINAGVSSFLSAQELSLIQNRIIYAFKPDAIVVLNGANDSFHRMGKNFYLSNSNPYQRYVSNNINRQSKSFFYFVDDYLSKNISTYFLLKKIIEKTSNIIFFEEEERKFYKDKSLSEAEAKEYRYFYNTNILSKLSNNNIPIINYLQPQMLSSNYNTLNKNDKVIYDRFNLTNPNYFNEKNKFYKLISNNIKKYNNLNSENYNFYDISNILSINDTGEPYYSDHVHYNHNSREIISERIFNDLQRFFMKN